MTAHGWALGGVRCLQLPRPSRRTSGELRVPHVSGSLLSEPGTSHSTTTNKCVRVLHAPTGNSHCRFDELRVLLAPKADEIQQALLVLGKGSKRKGKSKQGLSRPSADLYALSSPSRRAGNHAISTEPALAPRDTARRSRRMPNLSRVANHPAYTHRHGSWVSSGSQDCQSVRSANPSPGPVSRTSKCTVTRHSCYPGRGHHLFSMISHQQPHPRAEPPFLLPTSIPAYYHFILGRQSTT